MMNIANKKRRAALGDVSNEVEVEKHGGKRKCTVLKTNAAGVAQKGGKDPEATETSQADNAKLCVSLKPVVKSKAVVKPKVTYIPKPAKQRRSCNVNKLCSPIQKLCVDGSSKVKKQAHHEKKSETSTTAISSKTINTISKPTTSKPITSKPTTSKPITSKPTTSKPTTSKTNTTTSSKPTTSNTTSTITINTAPSTITINIAPSKSFSLQQLTKLPLEANRVADDVTERRTAVLHCPEKSLRSAEVLDTQAVEHATRPVRSAELACQAQVAVEEARVAVAKARKMTKIEECVEVFVKVTRSIQLVPCHASTLQASLPTATLPLKANNIPLTTSIILPTTTIIPLTTTTFPPTTSTQSWVDIDSEQHDLNYMSEYVDQIFKHYKERELLHCIGDYMSGQGEMSEEMRAILVDWLVEVQQSFELNHETLYTAVKLVDMYASRRPVHKIKFQLIGAVALNLAAKFEERCPPMIDDFVFICDDAYDKQEFLLTEMEVLSVCDFNLSLPLSYTFLRRYAMCAKVNIVTLTLSRFILETSLLHYTFVSTLESVMAAAALLLAMAMNQQGRWDQTMVHYSGYSGRDIINEVNDLNHAISNQSQSTTTILSKYSHPIFHEVAKIDKLTPHQLRAFLSSYDTPP